MNITVFIENDNVTISDLPDDLVNMMISLGSILKTSCNDNYGDDYCG
ncbi:hypothetical protein LCGC14_0225310 [marine sediment metagenome]|uniref:Uncharacterized protein n=1 Tax=marine sediment metagenome TaxID=412755 RepID=A0A0F9UTZ7_9ZZZZ